MTTIEVILPKWGLTMEEGMLASWEVHEGDRVTEGQVIAHVETDKVTNELEAPTSGIIKKLYYPEGVDGIPVGSTLCEIETA